MLILGACGDDSGSSGRGGASGASNAPLALTMTENGCDPTSLSAGAGDVQFAVTNESGLKGEFEIISSTPEIVIEEFLDDGASGTFKVPLKAGQYQVICGAPSNTRADLVISGEGEAAPGTSVNQAELAAAVTSYQGFVLDQTEDLATSTKSFTDAVRAGDTTKAKQLYAQVRIPWEQIEPVAELFPDSDAVIDSRADDFPKAEQDPSFTGFHALEYGLFAGGSVDMPTLADKLDSDIQALIANVKALKIQPQVMTNGAAALIEEAAQTKITGEEERYSGTDLVTLQANVDGANKVFTLVSPLLATSNKQLNDDLTAQFAKVQATLDSYKTSDGFESYGEVSEADRAKLKTSMAELSELLSQVSGSLGLQVNQ
ncbi:MAG TPA: iron uptake system protein EfeO [Acidimicrobiales bacterium]|nr:iron uptake system protein EfeO [Acidimicrobiales bacterium]